MLKGDSVEEVLNLDISLIEMVIITFFIVLILLFGTNYIVDWVSLICKMGYVELNMMGLLS